MNIDEKIKHSLQAEQHNLESILESDPGLFKQLIDIYKGKMRLWTILGTFFAFIFTAIFILSAYQFFNSEQQLFWAVCFVSSLMMQIAIKLWLFMEMNRQSIMKEIKRSELEIRLILSEHFTSNSQT
ncbi:alanyl-tRNA synthetase [Pseudoalteromonas porphyrae]|uniref:Alanyl-tRNA synthetase n=2 Tax=Pseudoalteromonas porphyrae TaxID=187330 RepID=A0A0N1EC72_9GAMM|nr:alanyl-tRNA synthetase [Pseudoalteromonas porphyrae]